MPEKLEAQEPQDTLVLPVDQELRDVLVSEVPAVNEEAQEMLEALDWQDQEDFQDQLDLQETVECQERQVVWEVMDQ